jgi:hypothetical protein
MVTVFSPLPATRGRPLLLLLAASYRKVGEVKLGTVIGGGLKKRVKNSEIIEKFTKENKKMSTLPPPPTPPYLRRTDLTKRVSYSYMITFKWPPTGTKKMTILKVLSSEMGPAESRLIP